MHVVFSPPEETGAVSPAGIGAEPWAWLAVRVQHGSSFVPRVLSPGKTLWAPFRGAEVPLAERPGTPSS